MAEKETAPAKPEKAELTSAEKKQILREAVSFYLRTNYLTGDTKTVCEEFIADIDDEVRAGVEAGARGTHSAPPPQHKKA